MLTRTPSPIALLLVLLVLASGCATSGADRGSEPSAPEAAPAGAEASPPGEGPGASARRPVTTDAPGDAPAGPPEGAVPPFLRVRYEIEPFGFYRFRSGLKDRPGDVETAIAGLRLETSFPVARTTVLGFEGGYEWRNYEFGSSEVLPEGGRPFDGLHTFGLVASWLQVLGDDWMRDWQLFVRGRIQLSAEGGAKFEEGISVGGVAVVGKAFTKDLRLGFGVAASSELEDDPTIFPAIQFVWQVSEDVKAEVVGPGLDIEWTMDEQRKLAFNARYEYRRFRLEENGPGEGGVFGDATVPLTLRFSQKLGRSAELVLRAGVDIYRELEFVDDGGRTITKTKVDPNLFLGLALRFTF
jgi:hypothetical protein